MSESVVNKVFSFPNPVNEVSARIVAGGVVIMAAAAIVFDQPWITAVIAYGFVARVLSGPTLSPLGPAGHPGDHAAPAGQAEAGARPAEALRAGHRRRVLGHRGRAGARIRADHLGLRGARPLIVAATLESVFAICLGCQGFAVLMRLGVIPEAVCEECNNIWLRAPAKV